MFTASVVTGRAHVSAPVARLIGTEAVERPLAAPWQRADIPVMRIPPVIYVPIEAARTVIPGSRPEENPASEPVGAVIAIWGAVIGRIVEIPVRAHRRRSNRDRNLSRNIGNGAAKNEREAEQTKSFEDTHIFHLCRSLAEDHFPLIPVVKNYRGKSTWAVRGVPIKALGAGEDPPY
jgi:hypothetical protein